MLLPQFSLLGVGRFDPKYTFAINDCGHVLGRTCADGADVVDYLAEIPLPGRILASQAKNLARGDASAVLPSFVAGPENRLVATAVSRLLEHATHHARLRQGESSIGETHPHVTASRRDASYHPPVLNLFGPSGVGKTHLAHGLVRHWQRERGDDAALYVTAADFRRQFHEAIASNRVEEFRSALRSRRLLAIDDIHRMPNDDYLMQELRYTLDAFEEGTGAIIVTSPRPANVLSNLPPDIRGRLVSGLSLQLAQPGAAARVRIIRHASRALGHDLSLDAASRLADGITGTATQVFGALSNVWAAPSPSVGSDAARSPHHSGARRNRAPAVQEIIAVVARYTNIPQKQLKSASRRQSIVSARALAVYLARVLCRMSYDQIGRAFGGRDHTTIMYNFKKIERQLTQDVTMQEVVAELCRVLSNR